MTLSPGHKLGPFEVVGPLGKGGMGEVYKARDTRLNRTVALKIVLRPDAAARSRFQREARAICSLNHPLICGLYDVGEQDGIDYLVMEFVEGETLAAVLKRGPLAYQSILRIAAQAAEALAAAHARGIVHRDLKPGNIILTKTGIKLLDFGLAKPAPGSEKDLTQTMALTEEGAIAGTLQYMAPEVLEGGEADARSDIFALGAMLYEMASGSPPFAGKSKASTVAAILEHQPRPLSEAVTGIPPQFGELVAACLQKDPADRWQSAADVGHALRLLDHEPHQPAAAPLLPPSRRLPPSWLIAALALLAISGAAILGYLSRQVPEPAVFQPLTFSGQDFGPSASPDGKLVAFTSTRDGGASIWLKDMLKGDERLLTGAAGGTHPRFSPDGTSILYNRAGNLYRMNVLGGSARRIIEDVTAAGGTWSPDGQRIAFARRQDQNIQIWIAGANGENPHMLLSGVDPVSAVRWSPDGKTIVGVLGSVVSSVSSGRILVLDETTRKTHVLSSPSGGFGISAPAFCSPNEVLYSQALSITGGNAIASGGSRLIRQNLDSGHYTILARNGESTRVLDIAGAGALVLDSYSSRQNLVEFPLDDKARAASKPVVLGTSQDRQPVYSPDGAWILFSSNRSGNADLWKLSTTSGELRRVTDDPGQDWDPAFTPDGKQIVWSSQRSGNLEIWIADNEGAGPRQITHDGFDAENPGVTGDGWLFYVTGSPERRGLWKTRLDGTGATRVVEGRVTFPELSPDGRYLIFTLSGLKTVVIETATSKPVLTIVPTIGRTRWTPDGKRLIFESRGELVSQEFVPGRDNSDTRKVLLPSINAESFGVSPDGKRIVVSLQESAQSLLIARGIPGVALPVRK